MTTGRRTVVTDKSERIMQGSSHPDMVYATRPVTQPLAPVRDIGDAPFAASRRGRFVERPQRIPAWIDAYEDHHGGPWLSDPQPDHPAPGQPSKPRPSRRRVLSTLSLLLLLPSLLAALAAYIATAHFDDVWAGRSEIMFHLSDMPTEAANRFLQSQPVILTSYAVVEPVAREEGMGIDALMENLDARIVAHTNFLRIEYQDTDTDRLQRILEALTRGYLGVLRDVSAVDGASHRLLNPPYIMEKPVSPRPIRTAAIGAVLGLVVAFAGLVVMAQMSRSD